MEALNSIFAEIKKRRIDTDKEGIGERVTQTDKKDLVSICLQMLANSVNVNLEKLSFDYINADSLTKQMIYQKLGEERKQGDYCVDLLEGCGATFVRLSSFRVTDNGIIKLGQLCPQITNLCLRGCYTISIQALTKVCELCPNVTALDVGWVNCFQNAQNADLITKFFKALNPKLQQLSIRGSGQRWINERVSLIKSCLPELESLNVGKLKTLKAHQIVSILESCTKISDLQIDNLQLSTPELSSILNLIGSNLISLNIECNFFTDATLHEIGMLCPKLQILSLKNNVFFEPGFISMVNKNTGLLNLDLSGCFDITDEGILELAKNCTNIEALNMDGLSQVTTKSINALNEKCPNLNELQLPENLSTDITNAYRATIMQGKIKYGEGIRPYIY